MNDIDSIRERAHSHAIACILHAHRRAKAAAKAARAQASRERSRAKAKATGPEPARPCRVPYGSLTESIISQVAERGPVSAAEIAAALGIKRVTASWTLKRLKRLGRVCHAGHVGNTNAALYQIAEG